MKLIILALVLPLLLLVAAAHKVVSGKISKHNMVVGETFGRDCAIFGYLLNCVGYE